MIDYSCIIKKVSYCLASMITTFFLLTINCTKSSEDKKPNIVLILVDDYGYADISFEGNTQIQTPGIDQIAEQGVRFTHFYQCAAASAPTRASLLTGRYHLRTGVWGVHWGRDFIRQDETTIAEVMKSGGYVTGAFGKWHSGKSTGYHSWNRGFDVGLESRLYIYNNTNVIYNNKVVHIKKPMPQTITDQAIHFIETYQDSSFFCYVPFQSIHEPFDCPKDRFRKYKDQGYSDHVARLYGMIEELDHNIARLMKKLEELKLDENTLVMFMVDDGCSPGCDLTYQNRRMNDEEKAERRKGWKKELRGTKANIWEGGMISPCYFKWKGTLPAGKTIEEIAGVIDIFPTLVDLCGIELPEDNLPIDGKSLKPLLFDQHNDFAERIYFDNTNLYQIPKDRFNQQYPEIREMSARYKNYKMIRHNYKLYGTDKIEYQLYDLLQDPTESQNVIENYPEVSKILKDTLAHWFDGIVNSGSAFQSCTYYLGDWNERATFINLDGISAKTGTLKRDTGPGFKFTHWDTQGNCLSFNIDVIEEGDYSFEIFIDAQEKDLGGVLQVSTEHNSTEVVIDDVQKIKSDPFHLPAGEQTLNITLKELGPYGVAMDWMHNILAHRIPNEKDHNVIQEASLTVTSPASGLSAYSEIVHDSYIFCTDSELNGEVFETKANEKINLEFICKPTLFLFTLANLEFP